MDVQLILSECQKAGITLSLNQGILMAEGAKKAMTTELAKQIQAQKAGIIENLKREAMLPTRPQFRIRLKDGQTFLQSHSAGVTLEEVKAFNEKEWGPVASVESVPWDSDKKECGDFEAVAAGKGRL